MIRPEQAKQSCPDAVVILTQRMESSAGLLYLLRGMGDTLGAGVMLCKQLLVIAVLFAEMKKQVNVSQVNGNCFVFSGIQKAKVWKLTVFPKNQTKSKQQSFLYPKPYVSIPHSGFWDVFLLNQFSTTLFNQFKPIRRFEFEKFVLFQEGCRAMIENKMCSLVILLSTMRIQATLTGSSVLHNGHT